MVKIKWFFAIVAVIALFLSACADENPKPRLPVGEKAEDVPNFVIQEFRLKSSDGPGAKWELEATGAQIFEMKKKTYIQNFKMKVFDENGKYSIMTGDRAVINTDTYFLEASGNVRVKADNGMELATDSLFWDDVKKTAYGNGDVTVYKDNTVLKGRGFESDLHMRNLKIHSRVKLKAKDILDE
ncbi:MAG TPA: LPS export ABC transporter periplasmic protein LptC [Candidatus Goldiibacteriota bacterium]|nr:LPS export ABC transporter periplasmic protein LptC [Candidatus Goldiibacteriota bacterium]